MPTSSVCCAVRDPLFYSYSLLLLYRMTQRQLSSRYTGQICDGGVQESPHI